MEEALGGSGPAVHLLRDDDPRRIQTLLTREVLRERARRAAATLFELGVSEGDRVALCLPTGEAFIHFFLGALWMGAVPIPLPAPIKVRGLFLGLDRIVGAVSNAEAKLVVAETQVHRTLIRALSGVPVCSPELSQELYERPPAEDPDQRWAFIQYTAGSTGQPKGVVITFGNLRANLSAIAHGVKLKKTDRVLSWLPLHHDMGLVGTLLFPLVHGLPLFLYSPIGFALRPAGWLQGISEHRATLTAAPHFAYGLCARKVDPSRLEQLDLSSWRLALDGAEPIHVNNVRAFIERYAPYGFKEQAYLPVYGMSEATLAVAFPSPGEGIITDKVDRARLSEQQATRAETEDAVELISVGRPLQGIEVEIRAPRTGELLEEREVGEIWIRGASVSPRYVGERKDRDALHTGDLGYVADGRLFILDRVKDLIIHGGANLYPTDVEAAAFTVRGVRKGRAVAFGAPDPEDATEALVVAAEVSTRLGHRRMVREIREEIRRRTGVVPQDVVLLKPRTLPRTTSGKLRRSRTREAYLQHKLK